MAYVLFTLGADVADSLLAPVVSGLAVSLLAVISRCGSLEDGLLQG